LQMGKTFLDVSCSFACSTGYLPHHIKLPSLYSCFYSPFPQGLVQAPVPQVQVRTLRHCPIRMGPCQRDLSPAVILVNSTSPLQMQHIPCLMHQGVGFVPEVVDIAEVIRKHMYLDHRSMRQSRKKPPAKSISSKDDATSCQPIFVVDSSIHSKLEESVYDDEQGIVTLTKVLCFEAENTVSESKLVWFFPVHSSISS